METQPGLEGEEVQRGRKDLSFVKEAVVGLTQETVIGKESETSLETDGGSMMDGETEADGEIETRQHVCGETGAELEGQADRMKKTDGERETLSRGATNSLSQKEEEEVMEEEQSGFEEEELSRATSDSVQGEELILSC